MINLVALKPGDTVQLKDGSTGEVVENPQDGMWIMIRYIVSPADPDLVGTEELCHAEQVADAG
ncbi:hypothetical protein [Muricoccus vinaceus]|uniref:Uncharacterized protein n=1 Tax=Muricoccus vinaceus TaxID=424704 RepID=A0ABV6IR83_9PROT